MLTLMLLLAAAQADPLIAKASEITRAEPRCVVDPDSTDVTVCGLRNADRFRVPLILHDPGDRRYEGVGAERTRLLHKTTPIQDLGPFLVGGGALGVTATASFGSSGPERRKFAP